MKLLAFLFFVVAVIAVAQGKVYTRCEMARILRNNYGFTDMVTLANWVCLIQYESGFNDRAIGSVNYDGTQDFGLFQINNKWWCQGSIASYNTCKISCNDLLGNLDASVKCAKTVYAQQGYKAWYGWINGCQNKFLSVADCF